MKKYEHLIKYSVLLFDENENMIGEFYDFQTFELAKVVAEILYDTEISVDDYMIEEYFATDDENILDEIFDELMDEIEDEEGDF